MHRPRVALLIAVAVAAACLSSPPAPRAAVWIPDPDLVPKLHHPGATPNGDSDQFTTRTGAPPGSSQTITPNPNPGPPPDGTDLGSDIGDGRKNGHGQTLGSRVRAVPVSGFEQLLRYLIRAFSGIVAQ